MPTMCISSLSLNTLTNGASTTSRGSPFHTLGVLTVRKSFLASKWNLTFHILIIKVPEEIRIQGGVQSTAAGEYKPLERMKKQRAVLLQQKQQYFACASCQILMNAEMVPISAVTTRYVKTHGEATTVCAQEGTDPRELEDHVWYQAIPTAGKKMTFLNGKDKTIDIDECENRDACQHECRNTLGSYQCFCPTGYRVTPNGKTCQDIDECLDQDIHCGPNRMCFNTRGSYQCIDTPCPPDYLRDPLSGFCLKNCPPNDLECAWSPYTLEYKLVSLPFGIAANQDLLRLVAYTEDGVMHPRTSFLMVNEDMTIPFALRDESLKGIVYTTRPLREPETYRMRIRALSYSVDGAIEYQTTFIVYIAVSAYPY
ncbi:Hemicentin-1 [Varanus komodoensis]|nr:Hemicentin-1 [Varanus komodoensis]